VEPGLRLRLAEEVTCSRGGRRAGGCAGRAQHSACVSGGGGGGGCTVAGSWTGTHLAALVVHQECVQRGVLLRRRQLRVEALRQAVGQVLHGALEAAGVHAALRAPRQRVGPRQPLAAVEDHARQHGVGGAGSHAGSHGTLRGLRDVRGVCVPGKGCRQSSTSTLANLPVHP
jgi:hypothetical protein